MDGVDIDDEISPLNCKIFKVDLETKFKQLYKHEWTQPPKGFITKLRFEGNPDNPDNHT